MSFQRIIIYYIDIYNDVTFISLCHVHDRIKMLDFHILIAQLQMSNCSSQLHEDMEQRAACSAQSAALSEWLVPRIYLYLWFLTLES
jgi:hypothetical protein